MAIYTGETYDTRTHRVDQLPNLGNDADPQPFTYLHSPASWECVDLAEHGIEAPERYEWTPRLKKFAHRVGVNGVDMRAGGVGRAIGAMREAGWVVVDLEHGPNGASYVRALKTSRGVRYCDAFTSFVKVGPNRYAPRFDRLGYLQWRRELVRSGVLPLPAPEILEGAIDTVKNQINRLEMRAHLPHVAEKVEALRAKLAGMQRHKFATDNNQAAPKRGRSRGESA